MIFATCTRSRTTAPFHFPPPSPLHRPRHNRRPPLPRPITTITTIVFRRTITRRISIRHTRAPSIRYPRRTTRIIRIACVAPLSTRRIYLPRSTAAPTTRMPCRRIRTSNSRPRLRPPRRPICCTPRSVALSPPLRPAPIMTIIALYPRSLLRPTLVLPLRSSSAP